MAEYTEKSVAIKSAWMILEGLGFDRARNCDLERTVLAVFESAPAADVVERKTATWLFPHLEPDDITGHVYAECSNCHKVRIVDDFCPACGARMVE